MKTCVCCYSTESHDTLADQGINEPIHTWHKHMGEWVCNRCFEDILLVRRDFYEEDEANE